MGISALNKPRNTHCPHATLGKGCQIYADRPAECAKFYCSFLIDADVPGHWRPKRSRMLLYYDAEARRMEVHVDPAKPDAWKGAPYHDELRTWARKAAPKRGQVVVCAGDEMIAILPDRDKRLGPMNADEVLVSVEYETPTNVVYDIIPMHKDDPRIPKR